ncbi:4-hydroxy-tetrahydrodipicolinate synthase [Paraburkholderia silvatlantica]|uniref:4-hydroxy-tetrahydrodipicolinate synthase n=1 Tax=Paraburkholderia silvatlantica TaxID=321895 RepID=A0A2V4TKW4_9BURK|nr:dihydrodipicolinate synthase family protein [Paraburkholderia silvatlantica]PYE15726.1 4-hydroxy-tetrahydrodipicolinate synthase [Paraburkholderia silvatlantica]
MIPAHEFPFHGVYAATLCPLDAEGRHLDEEALIRHLAQVTSVDGIVGLLINGHAGENFALSREEKRRVVEIARDVCGSHSIIVAGINSEDSFQAQTHADDAKAAGADALLLFPPYSWTLSTDLATVLAHHRITNANAQLPLMLYQAGVGTGAMAYTPDMLAALVALPHVVAVKEGSWETARYEANRRLVQSLAPHVAVMASGDEHLMTCFALGTEGSLVSLAAVVPELVVELYRAMQGNDLIAARKAHERIYPLAKAIYGTAPGFLANARLKACLYLLGQFPDAAMRPPVAPLSAQEIQNLEAALSHARATDPQRSHS